MKYRYLLVITPKGRKSKERKGLPENRAMGKGLERGRFFPACLFGPFLTKKKGLGHSGYERHQAICEARLFNRLQAPMLSKPYNSHLSCRDCYCSRSHRRVGILNYHSMSCQQGCKISIIN